MKLSKFYASMILATAAIISLITATGAEAGPAPKAAWESRWETTVAAGKKEGRVTIYSHLGRETIQWLQNTFKSKYGINVEVISGQDGEILQKMTQERKANLNIVDVVMLAGGAYVQVLKPQGMIQPMEEQLILPEVTDDKRWLGGRFPWFDKDRMVVAPVASYFSYMLINTELVKKGEITAYKDLLDPKWRGKIVSFDPTKASPSQTFVNYFIPRLLGPEAGKEYLKALAKQDLSYVTDARQIIEWVAKGKFPIAIGASGQGTVSFVKAGAPISFVRPQEGGLLAGAANLMSIVKDNPHPNATAVFLNWLLTAEGQAGFAANQLSPSLRLGVPYTGPDQFPVVQSGDKTIPSDETFYVEGQKRSGWAKEIFGSYVK